MRTMANAVARVLKEWATIRLVLTDDESHLQIGWAWAVGIVLFVVWVLA